MAQELAADNRREIFGWVMYDWANSPFASTVATVFLGPYLASLVRAQGGTVEVWGYAIEADAFFPFCVSISVVLQVILLPILGTVADYTDLKKRLLLGFAYLGALTTLLMFWVQVDTILLGGMLFILANLAFGAALVFYNAFLPDIVGPDRRDDISSKGFALGYLAGGLALMFNLALVSLMSDTGLAVRLSLASAGLWWLLFTGLIVQRRLIQRPPEAALPAGASYLTHSFRELWASLKEIKTRYPKTLQFLLSFLVYSDGISTVAVVATTFAVSEIGVSSQTLVLVMLTLQFVSAGGALLFDQVARRIGAKRTIMICLVIWGGAILYSYFLLYTELQFWILGGIIGLVFGSSPALSRSLFSQMVPHRRESAYFGIYQISERGTSWLGPLLFAAAVQLTGSARVAMLPILAFFIIGLVGLYLTNVRAAIEAAGNELPTVV